MNEAAEGVLLHDQSLAMLFTNRLSQAGVGRRVSVRTGQMDMMLQQPEVKFSCSVPLQTIRW